MTRKHSAALNHAASPPLSMPDEICESCCIYRDRVQAEDTVPIDRCLCEIARRRAGEYPDGLPERLEAWVIGGAFVLLGCAILAQIAMRAGWLQ